MYLRQGLVGLIRPVGNGLCGRGGNSGQAEPSVQWSTYLGRAALAPSLTLLAGDLPPLGA